MDAGYPVPLPAPPPIASGSTLKAHPPPALVPHPHRPRYDLDLAFSSDDDVHHDVYADSDPPRPRRKRPRFDGDEKGVGGSGRGARGGKGKGKAKAIELSDDDDDDEEDDMVEYALRGRYNDVEILDGEGDLIMDHAPTPQPRPRSPSPLHDVDVGAQAGPSGATDGGGGGPAPPGDNDPSLLASLDTICSILPDVSPSYVSGLLVHPLYGPGNVELILEALFANEGKYPKREGRGTDEKGKGKAVEVEEERDEEREDQEIERKAKVWVKKEGREAGGKAYEDAALAQLYLDFPSISQANLKKLFVSSSSFYTPTYLAIEAELKKPEKDRSFTMLKGSKPRTGKGKGRAHEEFERERIWVVVELPKYLSLLSRRASAEAKLEAEIASGAFFECGCCFADSALSQMVTCIEGCEFCKDCARMNAESQVGMRKYVLPCMSTSGCKSTFSEREAERFLPRKTLNALHKIKQEKELGEAGIEGLEMCPFCPFCCIIENPDERLFYCQRDDCKIVSCRQCKKKDHLPKTCAEVDDNAKISTVHKVEEAMSEALIRRCPKPGCGEPYVKENGTCNKIICSSCRTLSCYICNQIITGYQHFANAGSNAPGGSEKGATCDLWDDTSARNFQEVEAARIKAEAEARLANPGVTDEDLKKLAMDKPGAPPAVIAHLAAPRVAEYEALVGARLAAAAPGRVIHAAVPRLPPTDAVHAARLPAAPKAKPKPKAAVTAAKAAAKAAREQLPAALQAARDAEDARRLHQARRMVENQDAAGPAGGAARLSPPPQEYMPALPAMYPPAYQYPAAGPAPPAALLPLNARNLAALAGARYAPPAPAPGAGGANADDQRLARAVADKRYKEMQDRKVRLEQARVKQERKLGERSEEARRKRREKDEEREAKRRRLSKK
ncbi:hypothetical protein JCM8547_006832 [Rhodosporidiobolus lusitaniae]